MFFWQEWSNSRKWLVAISTASVLALASYMFSDRGITGAAITEDAIVSQSSAASASRQLSPSQPGIGTERVILSTEPPYLSELPILDGNLYVNHDNNNFLLGGVDLSVIRYSAWSRMGGAATRQDRAAHIEFSMAEQPYIEFSYKGKFYSIEVTSRSYSQRMELREISAPTVELDSKFG